MDHRWANLIIRRADDDDAMFLMRAINSATAHGISRAAVIVVCAQILAQNITDADPAIAAEMREGVLLMIDDFAMRFATDKEP